MNNINYICARWRDASDCPPIGRRVPVLLTDGRMSADRPYDFGDGVVRWNDHVMQWLDITDVPAVAVSEIETLVTAAFIRRYPGGRPEPLEIPGLDARAPEPAEIEAQRTLLIEEMIDHGMHAEDAAASVDGLIGVCQRGTVPRAAVQAAVDEIARLEDCASKKTHEYADGQCCAYDHALDELRDHTGVVPS